MPIGAIIVIDDIGCHVIGPCTGQTVKRRGADIQTVQASIVLEPIRLIGADSAHAIVYR